MSGATFPIVGRVRAIATGRMFYNAPHQRDFSDSMRRMVQRQSIAPYLWMLQACLVFTAMGVLTHALGQWCDWQLIVIARAGLVLLFVAGFAKARGKRILVIGSPTLWIRSIAGSLSMVCTFYALTRLPVSATLTLTNMFPIWVALLSWPLFGEPPPLQVWIALAGGSVGVFLVQQPHFGENGRAVVAGAAASVFTAVAMLGLNRLRDVEPQSIVVHFSAVATVVCTASWFLFEHLPPREIVPPSVIVLMLLGIGVTASFGQVLLTRAFAAGDPSRVAIVSLSQIIFALVPDALVFDHPVDATTLIGIVLIAAPTAWLMAREYGRARPALSDPDGTRPNSSPLL
jgi:drug/metabolite transporter (DMT)-like permease